MAVTTAREVFESHMPTRLQEKPQLQAQVNAIYKFAVQGEGGGTWLVDLTQPGGKVAEGDGEAACTVTVGADTLVAVVNRQTNAQRAFMTGKIKVSGDMKLAMKLTALLA